MANTRPGTIGRMNEFRPPGAPEEGPFTAASQLHSRAALVSRGYSDGLLGAMCGREELVRLRRGMYVEPAVYGNAGRREQHLPAIVAACHALDHPAAVSHTSAAVLHGLPLWNVTLDRVHLTRGRRHGGCSNRRRVLHALPLTREDTVEVGGITVTSLARTIANVGCMGLFEQAVIMGDHALNKSLLTEQALSDSVAGLRGRRGVRTAHAATAAMDLRSESPGETRCRLVMQRLGIAPTELQRVVRHRGTHIARVDFADPDRGIVTEFDGMLTYKLDGLDSADVSDALAREKQREERLTNLGLQVVRVVWKDLSRPEDIARRHANALALARRAPPPLWDPPRASDAYVPRLPHAPRA